MKSNWEDIAKKLLLQNIEKSDISCECNNEDGDWIDDTYSRLECVFIKTIQEVMNMVFEATKKECADKAKNEFYHDEEGDIVITVRVDKESILNINKPNL